MPFTPSDLKTVTERHTHIFDYAEVAPMIHSTAWNAPKGTVVRGGDCLLGSAGRMRRCPSSHVGLRQYLDQGVDRHSVQGVPV